jgi:hypothetical protein
MRLTAGDVKRGVWGACGLPHEISAMSKSESTLQPTSMLFHILVHMDLEESIRGNSVAREAHKDFE